MEEIYEYLLKESGIRYRDVVAVGVSGGPDSMALLDLLIRLKEELDLIVIVCHVNHNVREESKIEEELIGFVKRIMLSF